MMGILRLLLAGPALGLFLSLWPLPIHGQAPQGPWRQAAKVPVAPEAWSWNWASWDQDKIATFGDFQYTVYWDAGGAFVLARRDLRDNTVRTLRLPKLTLASNDPHRNTCLGISPEDGRLHLSWDHHNNPLRYTRSRRGFLTDPPARMTAEDIEPEQPIAKEGSPTSRVTYPRFFNDAAGHLFLFYRQGGSGNGDNYLYRYRGEDGTWGLVGLVFSSRGTYAPWQDSRSRNAYFHDLLFDANNRLHATWVYREVSGTWASNHDLHYAYSDDGGRTWQNNAGERIADVARGDPIELADPGIVVHAIPVFSWMMNAGCMGLDSRNRPHVITYKLPSPRKPDELRHDPPPEIRRDLRFVHYWRADDGSWRGGEPIPAAPEGGSVTRGDILFGADDTLYFFHADRTQGVFRCLEARAADQWQHWQSYALTGSDVTGKDASKHDRRRWAEEGVLSFTAQLGSQGFGIVDLTLKRE
jgi:hypothetical protein